MRPIPVDLIPSHVYLSQKDQIALFGSGYAMTVAGNLSQAGQYVCQESVDVHGRLKRGLKLRVLGPHWENSHVEVSSVEASYLGYDLEEVRSGNTESAKPCRLVGPEGEVELKAGLIVTKPHLLCSAQDAQLLSIANGQDVSVELLTQTPQILDGVTVRVHPTYQLRIEIPLSYARDFWIARSVHARLLD